VEDLVFSFEDLFDDVLLLEVALVLGFVQKVVGGELVQEGLVFAGVELICLFHFFFDVLRLVFQNVQFERLELHFVDLLA